MIPNPHSTNTHGKLYARYHWITELLFPETPAQNGIDTQLKKHHLNVRFNFFVGEKEKKKIPWEKC